MGICTTFFTPCSPQNKAPQGGAPRRDGLRPSPWLRHGPCGAPSPGHPPAVTLRLYCSISPVMSRHSSAGSSIGTPPMRQPSAYSSLE